MLSELYTLPLLPHKNAEALRESVMTKSVNVENLQPMPFVIGIVATTRDKVKYIILPDCPESIHKIVSELIMDRVNYMFGGVMVEA